MSEDEPKTIKVWVKSPHNAMTMHTASPSPPLQSLSLLTNSSSVNSVAVVTVVFVVLLDQRAGEPLELCCLWRVMQQSLSVVDLHQGGAAVGGTVRQHAQQLTGRRESDCRGRGGGVKMRSEGVRGRQRGQSVQNESQRMLFF